MSGLLVLVLVAGLIIGGAVLGRAVKTHGAGPLAWRWLTGQPWHGRPYTNATWLKPGDRVLHPSGRAVRWHHVRRAYRAGARTGATVFVLGTLAGLVLDRGATLLTLGILAALAIAGPVVAVRYRAPLAGAWGGLRGRAAGRLTALAGQAGLGWHHQQTYLRPLHLALAPVLGVPLATRPGSWLDIPRNFGQDEDAEIRITLPDKFTGSSDLQRMVLQTVQAKLGLEDTVTPRFSMVGSPYLTLVTTKPPPGKVTFASVRDRIAELPETTPLIGLGRKSAVVTADLEADSPHILVSAGSGGGKSVLAGGLLSQGLHHGGLGLVLDLKRTSHRWARGLPSVHYCRNVEEIHWALLWVQTELDRRNAIVDERSDDNGDLPPGIDIGPRLWLVCEEMNATVNRLTAYWRKIKTRDDSNTSPAIEALGDFLFMGRAVRMNAIAIAQLMTAKTLGGPEARENFNTRCLTRYQLNAWRMLVPQIWPMPRIPRHKGRWQIVSGDEHWETQVLFMTPQERRAWALAGTVADFPQLPSPDELAARLADPATSEQADRTPLHLVKPLETVTSGTVLVGLAEACSSGVLSVSLASARAARARDPEFPRPVDQRGNGPTAEALYRPVELRAWEDNRERASVG